MAKTLDELLNECEENIATISGVFGDEVTLQINNITMRNTTLLRINASKVLLNKDQLNELINRLIDARDEHFTE